MIIPRFTLGWLLLLMAFVGVVCLIVAQAVRGQTWAMSVSLAAAGVVVCFAFYAVLFGVAFLLACALGMRRKPDPGGTPFATAEPPAQMVPPDNPE